MWSKDVILAACAALAVALPWHLWSLVNHGRSFIDQYVLYYVVDRFMQPLEGHNGAFLGYVNIYLHNAGAFAFVHAVGIALATGFAVIRRDRSLGAVVILAAGAFLIVSSQSTKIGWYLTPVYPGAALATALALTRIFRRSRARLATVLLLGVLAVPGFIYGRGRFVEDYNILDYSPEVRLLRSGQPFFNRRVPILYVVDLSDPAPRFYLADDVRSIDINELERLITTNQSFICFNV